MNNVVLLAEESPTARAILCYILKQVSFDVVEADRKDVALNVMSRGLYAAIMPARWLMEKGDGAFLEKVVLKRGGGKTALIITGEAEETSNLPKRAATAAVGVINTSNDAGTIVEDIRRIFSKIEKETRLENGAASEPEETAAAERAAAAENGDKAPAFKTISPAKKEEPAKGGTGKKPEKLKQRAKSSREKAQKTILLVDDSPLIIGMNSQCLEGAGYKIITASDGVEGAEKAFEFRPDLIVSDVEMPRMNGYQMVRLLKTSERTSHIPVVMNTTLSEARDRFWGKMAGADRYLVKGSDLDELARIVNKTLEEASDSPEEEAAAWGGNEIDVVEQVNYLLDKHLFRSTIVSEVRSYSQSLTDFELTIKRILEFLGDLIDHDISILFLPEENEVFINAPRGAPDRAIMQVWERLQKEVGNPADGPNDNPAIVVFKEDRAEKGGAGNTGGSFIHYVSKGETERSKGAIALAVFTGEKNKYGDPHRETLKLIADEARLVAESSFLYRNLERANEWNGKLQNLLKSYVSRSAWEDAMDTVEKGGNILSEREKEYTILFSDICGFTSMSERLGAKQVIDFLNTHFSFVTTVVQANHGDVDKYIGDCIMGKFEEPADAVRAAFQIQNILHSGRHALAGMGIDNLQVRVGINTGVVIEGSIGSQSRKDYTVIGDAVNTASRVESACPKGEVMITRSTYERVADVVDVIKEDVIKVKGKEVELHVYVVAEKGKKRFNGGGLKERGLAGKT